MYLRSPITTWFSTIFTYFETKRLINDILETYYLFMNFAIFYLTFREIDT